MVRWSTGQEQCRLECDQGAGGSQQEEVQCMPGQGLSWAGRVEQGWAGVQLLEQADPQLLAEPGAAAVAAVATVVAAVAVVVVSDAVAVVIAAVVVVAVVVVVMEVVEQS